MKKRHWLSFPENIYLVFVLINFLFFFSFSGASTISGFFAAACSLPFDYVKTQIQKMQPDAEGKLPYSGSLDCALKTLKSGGPFKFYTGFPVYCVRIAPHVMVLSLSLSFSLYVRAFTYWCWVLYLDVFFFGSWHATEPFAENLLSLDCPLILDCFSCIFWFWDVCFYADDMDFPQPDSKAGEKCWFIVSLQGWGFLFWWSFNNVIFHCLVVFADLTDSHPRSKTIYSDNFTPVKVGIYNFLSCISYF